jgi:hypothetical protein
MCRTTARARSTDFYGAEESREKSLVALVSFPAVADEQPPLLSQVTMSDDEHVEMEDVATPSDFLEHIPSKAQRLEVT